MEKSPSPDDDAAACFAEYSELRGESARIGQLIASLLTRYKKMGVDIKHIKFAYTEAQHDDATERHKGRTQLLVKLNIIEWDDLGQSRINIEQLTPESASLISRGRAKADGWKAGNTGATRESNPYVEGTDEYALWLEKFAEGHAVRVKDGKADVVKASPRKRSNKGDQASMSIN